MLRAGYTAQYATCRLYSTVSLVDATCRLHRTLSLVDATCRLHSTVSLVDATCRLHSTVSLVDATCRLYSTVSLVDATCRLHSTISLVDATCRLHSTVKFGRCYVQAEQHSKFPSHLQFCIWWWWNHHCVKFFEFTRCYTPWDVFCFWGKVPGHVHCQVVADKTSFC